jgi:hypothetical protein
MKQTVWRDFILYIWGGWEWLYARIYNIQEISPGNMFRMSVRLYRGPRVELRDGTVIIPGDIVGEFHLANKELFRLQRNCSSLVKATMAVKKELQKDLTIIASQVEQGKIRPEVKAFYGITLFHRWGGIIGFDVLDFKIPTVPYYFFWLGQLLLLTLYHPEGVRRLKHGHSKLTTKVIWLSRAKLLHDFRPSTIS